MLSWFFAISQKQTKRILESLEWKISVVWPDLSDSCPTLMTTCALYGMHHIFFICCVLIYLSIFNKLGNPSSFVMVIKRHVKGNTFMCLTSHNNVPSYLHIESRLRYGSFGITVAMEIALSCLCHIFWKPLLTFLDGDWQIWSATAVGEGQNIDWIQGVPSILDKVGVQYWGFFSWYKEGTSIKCVGLNYRKWQYGENIRNKHKCEKGEGICVI